MPQYNLPTADASPAFRALDDFAKGFIEAAFFDATAGGASGDPEEFFSDESAAAREAGTYDGTIPGTAEVSHLPDDEIARVVAFLAPIRERMGADLEAACERDGYDLERAGRDVYFTIAGHGVGFWDREELRLQGEDKNAYDAETETMANSCYGTPAFHNALACREKIVSLGDRLTGQCGRGEISLYADGNAESYRVRFDCLYTSAPAA